MADRPGLSTPKEVQAPDADFAGGPDRQPPAEVVRIVVDFWMF
jgi:hypothetical protein